MNNYVMALFASGTTNFDYMGLGPLADAISAVATETATSNGNITYTMEMDYPINGHLASQLVEGNLIKAQVSKTPGDYMIFEINETLKSDDRTITVYCDAYANRILRMSFDNGGKFGSFGNVQQALNAARAQMTGIQSDFMLSSGLGTGLNMSGVTSKNTLPTTYQDFNAYLDAIMDKVQGNVRFGVNSIQIVSDRGRDITDTVLRDDKNTNGISIKVDTSNIVNRIIPMLPVKDKDGNVTQETKVGKIVTSSVAFKFINFYAGQVVSLDTQDLANSYFNRTNCDRPTTTATVQTSMLDEDLTDIRLFDRVQVYSSKIGYQAKLKVCERAFDILAGAVSEFKLGSSSVTIFNSQTSVVNAINSAVQSSQYAAITADGKNTAYYEGSNPNNPKENDLWFHSVNGINQIDQYVNGNWVTIVSDSTGEQINQKVSQLGAEAKTAVDQARSASEKTDQLASKYDDTSSLASQAMNKAVSAQGDASSAVATANSTAADFGKVNQKADSAVASALNAQSAASDAVSAANSTASGFGKVSQKADSAFDSAMNAQSNASDAVKQASSAAADSKDAKQIAGAVSQSYKTLTDGSTMTIAELESGLAVKLTKSDLDGYATQTWTQNQVKMTADGINGTISSIKSTVDGQTTSINDLKADSSSFKSQFTTVNNTLGKQATDIGTLQATSKELTTGFNTLTSDNNTNKNDISQLKQTATEVSSTLETVQTQVQNSAVGTNLLKGTSEDELSGKSYEFAEYQISGELQPGTTYTFSGFARVDQTAMDNQQHVFVVVYNGDWSWSGWLNIDGSLTEKYNKSTFTTPSGKAFTPRVSAYLSHPNDDDSKDSISGMGYISKIKLEKGSLATDWCPNPADNATVTAFSKLSQTVDGIKTDISKKIEQKDLNGYATQDWTQTQIKITADGINGTISSVKSTVDGQTTSINDLKADSSSFKSQFMTVNDSIDKHTTDISTLQSSSQELTSGFNTLTTDNNTNKNDISQLKQTATEVSSTLETVQTQVQNSAVGINLVKDSEREFAGKAYDFHGYNLASTTELTPGQTYTMSFSAKVDDKAVNCNQHLFVCIYNPSWSFSPTVNVPISTDYQRVIQTFTVPEGLTGVGSITAYMSHPVINGQSDSSADKSDSAGTGYIKEFKLEKGNLATDWCPNPADNATVSAVSTLSQTVDSIKTDISKKIEQKDLNGYATQTWAQNQINATADGINGTISSVKSTVDSHTTSINDLKADSSSFKSQFTTVNNTLGKHTTDIGTLQASSKSLSASFDSLNSDNDTNKHNISQLQASATTFNSTLMTVQQRVTDSAVGTNLITGTSLDEVSGKSYGFATYQISGELQPGTTYTLSGLGRVDQTAIDNQQHVFVVVYKSDWSWGSAWLNIDASLTTTYNKLTFTMPNGEPFNPVVSVYLSHPNNDSSKDSISGMGYISKLKLEKGSIATDWCRNPADTATVTALSSISQTIDSIQTTVRGKVDNDIYQSKLTELNNQITSVVGQVNNLGQRNLIYNSEITSNTDGWESNVPLYVGFNQWDHFNGSNSLVFSPHGFGVGDWSHAYSKMVPVVQGMQYSASSTMFITGNTAPTATYIGMEITFFNDNGDRVGFKGQGFDISKWGTRQFLKVEGVATPTDATKVCMAIQMNGEGNVILNHPMMVSDSTVGAYLPDTVGQSEFSQMATNINFKVSKDGVINAINISNEGTEIYGNKLHITAATYIDNAVIKDAMISDLNASKLHAGRIDASQIDVYNIDGSKINAYSITADKIQAGAMLIAMNSTLQTLKIGTDGLYTTNNGGTSIGKIHSNNLVQHPENWGLDMDLSSTGQYMAWGAQNEGDPTGGYVIKFGWTRNSSASDFGMPWGGFWFNDNVMLHKNLRFDGGGVDVAGAYQLMKFAWIEMNGTHYPFFGSSNLKAGWLFGSNETYLVRGGGVINASKILGVLNGQSYKFIKSLNPDGSVKVYTDVHF